MRYYGEGALGLVETVGLAPALEAADKTLKAAGVELVFYENVDSTLVTIMAKGGVAAVRFPVEAGITAAAVIGKLTAKNVMPRSIREVGGIVSVHDIDARRKRAQNMERGVRYMERYEAIGLVETFGSVFVLETADTMCKATDVELTGYKNMVSGYISVLVRGGVGACRTVVEAEVKAVEAMGVEVYNSVVVPRPHPHLEKVIARYSLEGLLPGKGCAS